MLGALINLATELVHPNDLGGSGRRHDPATREVRLLKTLQFSDCSRASQQRPPKARSDEIGAAGVLSSIADGLDLCKGTS
jgi:hypothetical protein